MGQTLVYLLIIIKLSCVSDAEDGTEVTLSCPQYQKVFGNSCYEFVSLQHTFSSAQAWCEQHGGHLAFIPDEETQNFLQRHLDPKEDTWLGVASPASNPQSSLIVGGPFFWLDGSPITYSRWVSSPQPEAACGNILKDSGFQWEATGNCDKPQPFICQFESGRSIVCAGHNSSLQCGSGQVLMIDGGFYGRKNIHYCRSVHSPTTTPTQLQCSWVDVVETLAAHCQGRQVCQITEIMKSFGEPCPQFGSYLSLEFRCEDDLTLSVSTVAAVFDDVTISVKGLLHLPREDDGCKLSTGDGHVTYLHSSDGSESTVVHRYSHPGTFVVAVECSHRDGNMKAQKISIEEPVREFGVIMCYSGKLSFHAANCKALYGRQFQIQMEVTAGTNVTYKMQRDEMLLSSLYVVRGTAPQNITVTLAVVKQLGPGCHQLTLYASNMVTFPEVSTVLQMCVLEEVAGLQASVLRDREGCLESTNITVDVSIEQGVPALLFFFLTGNNSSFSETRAMNTRRNIFQIRNQIQGAVQVKVRAWNVFSSLEMDFVTFASCGEDYVSIARKKHIRVARTPKLTVIASPPSPVEKKQDIVLSLNKEFDVTDKSTYSWNCMSKGSCKCQKKSDGLTHTIEKNCFNDPFQFQKYRFRVKKGNGKDEFDAICIILIPKHADSPRLTCTEGCNPVNSKKDAKMHLDCTDCQNFAWYVEDQQEDNKWDKNTQNCYKNAGRRPFELKQNTGTEFTVDKNILKKAKKAGRAVTVVVVHDKDGDEPFHNSYTIKTSSETSSPETSSETSSPETSSETSSAETTSTSTTSTSIPTTKSTTEDTSSPATTTSIDSLTCAISPPNGTILDAFDITCNTEIPCPKCRYCFKSHGGKHLRCSGNSEVKSLFLPLGDSSSNYSLIITATAKHGSFVVKTTITTQVLDSPEDSSSPVNGLKTAVKDAVAQLKTQGLLSGETVGQIFSSVSNKLNSQSDESDKDDRQKLREQMLNIMTDTIKEVPTNTAEEVQITAKAVTAIIQRGTELSSSSQEEASLLFASLSASLLHMEVSNNEDLEFAASNIVEGASNILDYPSSKNISDALLVALDNTQSALLAFKNVNEGPTIIQQPRISVFVRRVTPGSLNHMSINIPNCSCPAFSLPVLPSEIFPSDEPVDIRMLTLKKNPFAWNKQENIRGPIGALSLTTTAGSSIPVEKLSEDIEIMLPRPVGEQVSTSVLDLGNYSTTVLHLPSADTTLVLKMRPSTVPLPFKLLLGYMDYPTETNHVAMTAMPQQGTTQEEQYTWILTPANLKGNTGQHYLVVRPIVGPGIKSINASLSITSIATSCNFWDETQLEWSNFSCRVGVRTSHVVTQCLCNHLTFFGSSFFVTPNLVDPSRSAELFGTFAENPVVVCFVVVLFVVYLLMLVWARRKDLQDAPKVKVTVLEDNDPIDEYLYLLSVSTGHRRGASTSAQVTITLLGSEGNSEPHHLADLKKCVFERGAVDLFLLAAPFSLGDMQGVRLWHNNSGCHPAWYVGNVMVQDLQTEQKWHFLCNSWLAIDLADCSLDKCFLVSSEADLKKFSNLFFLKTSKDFSDGHLWYSVISRPPSSSFTCVQRVSCCFSLLLCTMLTSIMFYGIPTDPSEQTMDLGHFEFTWQQFMVGVQSSLIMFPINFLIVSIFRNTRPRETSCCKRKPEKPDILEQTSVSQTVISNVNVTLESVIKDITRIAHSLSKTIKSNLPSTESKFGPGQQVDINVLLSVVEDFIKQSNKTCDTSQFKAQSNLAQPQLPEGRFCMDPDGIQKKSSKTQYVYQQLCRIDKELSLLGPAGFHVPHSYSRAVQQVQGMKAFLEDQLFKHSCVDPEELTQKKKFNPAVSVDEDDDGQKKKMCHRGLPWWCIFFGWLLVIATSVVSGYFTMIYGLKFGKERSISWLVSMIISFFQSILVLQPLKVLCLAVFFALILKKVDEEDYQATVLKGNEKHFGNSTDPHAVRQDSSLYEPPPPADIEKMKRNKLLEQKAFALLREILTYIGFMWMLLLVAYGQRDPNAFFLNQHIRKSFSAKTSESMSLGDVFSWANTSLISNLFGLYPGFITDGNSKLVGSARLRQLRVQKNSCPIAGPMLHLVPACNMPYSWEVEDMGSYDPAWNNSMRDNISLSTSGPWKYQTQDQLRAHRVQGQMALYRGGGFVAELGPDFQNASRTLDYLFRNMWLDTYTRAIFVEFTVYNANANLFCIVTFLLESTAVGAFHFSSELQSVRLYQSTDGLYIFVMAAEIIYMLFIIYFMFMQGKLMKQQRCAYFRSKLNLLELSIILLSWGTMAVYIKRTLLGNRDISYYHNHKDQFPSFYETATADLTLQHLIAFLVLLATIKLWHLLRLNPKTNMITAALQRAWTDISGFLLIIAVMFVAYSTVSNVIYGWELSSYRTFGDALVTIISLQIGVFNYNEVLNCTPVLGILLFGSCVVFMTFVVLNLFISLILVAFSQEQIYHKPSDEEEIVDLMLKKIYNLFGIRYKNAKDTPGPDVGGADLTLNNSRDILKNSSTDVNILHTSDNTINP